MPKLNLIKNEKINIKISDRSNEVSLHEDILEILIKSKENICNQFDNIRGTFLIDHLAINIIDPNNEILIFSSTPSVEYNVLAQGLWKYDKTFSVRYQKDNRFYCWEDAYEREYFEDIKNIKEKKHGFTFGFNLAKEIESFQLIYSYATRYQKPKPLEYYKMYMNELYAIGDYNYKSIRKIYEQYVGELKAPEIIKHKYAHPPSFPFLKLISSKQ